MTFFEALKERIADAAPHATRDGVESVQVPAARWLEAVQWMGEHGYARFIDLTCVDHPEQPERFEVHLLLYSMDQKCWVRLVTRTDEQLHSVVSVFAGAHNYEREVFDLFGVVFDGHPQLTRIMLPDGWQGHPLQRDADMPHEPVDFTVTRELYKT